MAKRKVTRKTNSLFTYSPHYYSWGGDFKSALGGLGSFDLKGTFSGANVANMLKGGLASRLGSTVGNIAGGAIAGGLESGAGKAISNIGGTIGGAIGAVNPVLGGLVSLGSGVIGGATNALFGSKLNKENIAEIESANKGMNTLMVDSSNFDTIENQWGTQNFGSDFSMSDIGRDGVISNKAKNKFKELQKQQNIARNRALTAFESAAESADTQSDLNILSNFTAYGGPLYFNEMSEGGNIHIKPSKRGTFTAAAKKRGMGVQEFASKVLANKEDYSSAMVKKANFARNASKWKHADGGPLGEEGLSLEDFITQKINEKRAAALDKSRNRTSVKVPMISNWENEEQWKQRLNTSIQNAEKLLSRLMAAGEDGDYAKIKQRELDDLLEELDKGYPKLIGAANCMYNAGDCYGLNIPGNQTFAAKHKELGFQKAPKGSMEPGDLVQDIRMGYPTHAMIYDSKDNENNLLFNYARGYDSTSIKENYVKQGKYPLPIKDYDVYKYVGTPTDSTQWINEYKEMYNKKAEGGNLFTNGVTMVGNGGTHEYLEGQEYDVTEEEIKLLKKLGYEFEYL